MWVSFDLTVVTNRNITWKLLNLTTNPTGVLYYESLGSVGAYQEMKIDGTRVFPLYGIYDIGTKNITIVTSGLVK